MSFNQMHPLSWIPSSAQRLLDVGCNAGELLVECVNRYPQMALAGVDVNESAVQKARQCVPSAEIRPTMGHLLPFPDESFDCATCIEVIEHIPADLRVPTMREVLRVLSPGGRFVLRCPHDGVFSALDAANFRFRFPRLYKKLVGRGGRDSGYPGGSEDIVWHHHFTKNELLEILGPRFELEHVEYGGLLLFPIADILCWPFYRRHRIDSPMFRRLQGIANWDVGINYGRASFTILLVLRKLN
jgi:SAM-dependent methyltransferase